MPFLGLAPSSEAYELHVEEDFGCPERDTVNLPSEWASSLEREELGLVELAEKEYVLRCAKADHALARLRVAIQTYNTFLTFKHKNFRGQREVTRAEAKIASHHRDIAREAEGYRRQHKALVALGLKEEDGRRYRILRDDELKHLHVSAAQPERLGECQMKPAWFWAGDRDADESSGGTKGLDALTQEGASVLCIDLL